MSKRRCQGKRRQFRRNAWGVFKCTRSATTVIVTSVGFSKTHYCCDSGECFASIAGGYPVNSRPIQ